jgi:hypothetical protein
MPSPIYTNVVVPVDVIQDEPPKPVESSHSVPQKGAKHAIVYTWYAFGAWARQPINIPTALRHSREPLTPLVPTNQGMVGQRTANNPAVIVRVIPQSNSARIVAG